MVRVASAAPKSHRRSPDLHRRPSRHRSRHPRSGSPKRRLRLRRGLGVDRPGERLDSRQGSEKPVIEPNASADAPTSSAVCRAPRRDAPKSISTTRAAPFGTVRPRARKTRRKRPEGPSRPAPEPDRPEAPRQLAGSGSAPRRALRRENRRASCEAWKGRFEPPSPGFPPLRRLLNECSHLRRDCLSRLRCAFRFSQPLDALIRPRPFGLVSCRFRPWGSCSQRFPPPSSRHGSRRALSPGRGRRSRVDAPCLGIPAPGWSVHVGAVLPASDGRASLSVVPLRGSHPRALTPGYTGVSSHGLPHGADRSTP